MARTNNQQGVPELNCFKCGHEFKKGDSFCANCGKSFKKKPHAERSAPAMESVAPTGHYPNQDALKQIEKILAKRQEVLPWAGMLGIAALGSLAIGWLPAAILGGIAIAIVAHALSSHIGKADYQALPGATVDGQHRCIHCGNKGIYTHGQYKSNTTFHDCSRCKKTLYVS